MALAPLQEANGTEPPPRRSMEVAGLRPQPMTIWVASAATPPKVSTSSLTLSVVCPASATASTPRSDRCTPLLGAGDFAVRNRDGALRTLDESGLTLSDQTVLRSPQNGPYH